MTTIAVTQIDITQFATANLADYPRWKLPSLRRKLPPAPTLLTTPEQIDAFRSFAASFSAWPARKIGAWTATDCNAMLAQFVALALRDAGWEVYGRGDRIYRGDDGQIYYKLSV